MLTVTEARENILKYTQNFGTETVSIQQALGRILAEDLLADRDYPPFNRAAMDGFAILIENGESRNEINSFEVVETIFAGGISKKSLNPKECYKIMTGAAVPLSANAIIRIEDAVQEGNQVSFTINTLKSFQNIARRGEDLKHGELILKQGQLCSPAIISTLAVLGKSLVKIQKLPTFALISTGDEVKPIDFPLSPFQIRDSNSYAIEAFFNQFHIPCTFRQLVADNKSTLEQTLSQSIKYHITIISGGVSAGDADFVPEVLMSLGVRKVFHKVQIKPGKPLWFGITDNGNVVFALPGNPMSVQVALKVFIEPYIRKCLGMVQQPVLKLPLFVERRKKVKFDEFFPATIKTEERSGLVPVKFNGSGDITSTLGSDGLIFQPADKEAFEIGDIVEFLPW